MSISFNSMQIALGLLGGKSSLASLHARSISAPSAASSVPVSTSMRTTMPPTTGQGLHIPAVPVTSRADESDVAPTCDDFLYSPSLASPAPELSDEQKAWMRGAQSEESRAFQAKVQEMIASGTMPKQPELTEWQKEQRAGLRTISSVVGAAMMANAKFHILEPVTRKPYYDGETHWLALVNQEIKNHNEHAEQTSVEGAWLLGRKMEEAGIGNVAYRKDTGEYKLSAFQIRSPEGKLVCELKDDGRCMTYEENGDISQEFSRQGTSKLPFGNDAVPFAAYYGEFAAENSKYQDAEFF